MTTAVEPKDTRAILLGLIDEPDLPTRERMDPEKLDELGESIRLNGLFQPIGVEERGPRFTIIFGHRRYVASKLKGLPTIRAQIYPEGVDRALVMQAGENAHREKVNPAEEGDWLDELFKTRCDEDLEKLCALTGLSENHCSTRLLLVRGDPRLKTAVRGREMALTVALELNRIESAFYRDYYIQQAVKNGCNLETAKFYRAQAKQLAAQDGVVLDPATTPESAAASPPAMEHRCVCCNRTTDVHEMTYVQVHRYCQKAILEPLLEQRNGAVAT